MEPESWGLETEGCPGLPSADVHDASLLASGIRSLRFRYAAFGATLTPSAFRVELLSTSSGSRGQTSAAGGPGCLLHPSPGNLSLPGVCSSPGLCPRPAPAQKAARRGRTLAGSPDLRPPLPVPALRPSTRGGLWAPQVPAQRRASPRSPQARLRDPRPRPAPRPRPPAAPPSARPEAPGPPGSPRAQRPAAPGVGYTRVRSHCSVASSGPGKFGTGRVTTPGGGTDGGARGAGPGPGVGGRRPAASAAGAEGGPAPRWVPGPSGCTGETRRTSGFSGPDHGDWQELEDPGWSGSAPGRLHLSLFWGPWRWVVRE
ncbi:hypothetical protein P7K49_002023 [Saguinus oedipus]|uniref:Uncharacterized protein n=1 Tax=Saguinus oedipus TaxID=9490 RepID=A0ABQ9WK14_SAGOE|nr:hypothetical protein P7K49_002023 [Saguinus oedipus]